MSKPMPRKIPLLVFAVAASQCGATDCGEIIRDPGFDLWCGEQLCTWKVARGEIRQVPTWHAGDDGVELLGGDSAIFQLTPVESLDTTCIEFELLADVDPGVDLRFQVDVFGDGSVELDERIPSADWQPLVYRFDIDGFYQGVAFWITKQSEGHAVVAQLQARTCSSSEATWHIEEQLAPDGASCVDGAFCASGICEQFPSLFAPLPTCGACEIGAACPNGDDVCGLAPAAVHTLDASTACVPTGGKLLGAQCGVNEECADGWCGFGVCSTCFADSCAGNEACDVAVSVVYDQATQRIYPAPMVCAPRAAVRVAGEPCASEADCASGVCNGTPRRVCRDGRACANDSDCPVLDNLDHGRCETVGEIGGTCQ
jgi:hypothetical protein